jgi:polyadenylate-binding protein
VKSCKVGLNVERGVVKSRGYGFVCYEDKDSASKANEGEKSSSKKLDVLAYQPRDVREIREKIFTNLYVKNFPDENFTDSDLKQLFEPYGTIISAAVMKDDKGESKKFGFVCFENPEHARKAIEKTHNQPFGNDGVLLYCQVALNPQ